MYYSGDAREMRISFSPVVHVAHVMVLGASDSARFGKINPGITVEVLLSDNITKIGCSFMDFRTN